MVELVEYVMDNNIEEVEETAPFKKKKLFMVVIKYIAPVFIILILISSVLDAFGIMKI